MLPLEKTFRGNLCQGQINIKRYGKIFFQSEKQLFFTYQYKPSDKLTV